MTRASGGPENERGQAQQGNDSSARSEQDQAGSQGQERSSGASKGERQGSGKASGADGQGEESGQGDQKQQPSRVEWVVGIFCSIVVLTAVGYLFYQALSRPSLPPLIRVHAERVVSMPGGGFLVEVRVANEGSRTASSLMIEGALMQDTTAVEKSTATIDFVPAGTARDGGLFFTRDPHQYRLEVRPTGYDLP